MMKTLLNFILVLLLTLGYASRNIAVPQQDFSAAGSAVKQHAAISKSHLPTSAVIDLGIVDTEDEMSDTYAPLQLLACLVIAVSALYFLLARFAKQLIPQHSSLVRLLPLFILYQVFRI